MDTKTPLINKEQLLYIIIGEQSVEIWALKATIKSLSSQIQDLKSNSQVKKEE